MKTKTLFVSFFFCFNTVLPQSKHIIIISIDGLRPAFYRDAVCPTPTLQGLMKEGVYANQMRSVSPSYTYLSHVAILSSALPARSGIYYNANQEPKVGTGLPGCNSSDAMGCIGGKENDNRLSAVAGKCN
jgi:predicted AlkP superfamily pyrophosphatase or phosphodiesterase